MVTEIEQRDDLSCCDGALLEMIMGVEENLTLKQRAGERQQPIADGAQGPAMAMAALAQGGIALSADRIMLGGDARPMMEGSPQPDIAGKPPDHEAALAAAPGHRSDPGHDAQSVVISALERLTGLGEQRGEVDPSDPRQGAQDRHVALLGSISCLVLSRLLERAGEPVELAMGFLHLLVHQPEALSEDTDV